MKTLQLIEKYISRLKEQAEEDATMPPQDDEAAPESPAAPEPLSSEGEVYFADLLKRALGLKINENIKLSDQDKQIIATLNKSDSTTARDIIDKLVDVIKKYEV